MLKLHEERDTRGHYNEVILDAKWYADHLPDSLEAIVGDRETHAAFLKQYGLSNEAVPLLEYREEADVFEWVH